MKKIILLLTTLVLLLTGCGEKIVEVPVYIHTKPPLLQTYTTKSTFEFGKLYNKEGKVCVKRWDVCIVKKDFIELVDYMQDQNATITLSNGQVVEYNKWAEKENKR